MGLVLNSFVLLPRQLENFFLCSVMMTTMMPKTAITMKPPSAPAMIRVMESSDPSFGAVVGGVVGDVVGD